LADLTVFTYNFMPDFSLNITIMNKLNLILRLLISLVLAVSVTGCAGGKTYESTGEYFDDTAITTKVKTSILSDSKLKFFQINVKTFKGIVQLSGFVDSSKMATRAAEVARTVKGVKMVNNSLIVKGGVNPEAQS
jgi:osmotically-inducible protein OsmY